MNQKNIKSIYYIINSLERGGAELHLAQILPELDKKKYQIEIFLLGHARGVANELITKGVKIHKPWFQSNPKFNFLPWRIFRLALVSIQLLIHFIFIRPDIIHFFLPASYLIGGPLSIIARNKRRIMSRRSLNIYQEKSALIPKIEKILHSYMDVILANSKAVMSELIQEEGVSPKQAGIIYNGINLKKFDADKNTIPKGLPPLQEDELVIVNVANLIPYKGHEDLIRGLAQIKSRLPQKWKLLIIGRDDGIGEGLQQLVHELNIKQHILFLGSRNDVPNILKIADIGVLASHEEGFSNSILEKMASGLPLVVTNVGGNGEAVLDGKCGIVVPAKNETALGQAILDLTLNKEKREQFGKAGKQRIEQYFSLKRCVSDYERLYDAILENKDISKLKNISVLRGPLEP